MAPTDHGAGAGRGAFSENAAAVFERSQSMGGPGQGGLGVSRGAHMNCSGHASVSFPASAFAGPEWLHL